MWELDLSAEELMLLNCGVGKDSSESLGLQEDQTNPSQRKSVLNIHCKDWCWSWNSNPLATWCEELTDWRKILMLEKTEGRRRRGKQRMKWLNGITYLMDMSSSKLRELLMGREAWHAAVHGVTKSQTSLNDWTEMSWVPCNLISVSLNSPILYNASKWGSCNVCPSMLNFHH